MNLKYPISKYLFVLGISYNHYVSTTVTQADKRSVHYHRVSREVLRITDKSRIPWNVDGSTQA